MNHINLVPAFITIFLIAGCAQMQPQQSLNRGSNASPPQDRRIEIMRSGNQAAAECAKENRSTPNGRMVETNILIFSETQPNKLNLQSSKAKLNENQKKVLRQFIAENEKCRALRLNAASGTPYFPVIQKDQVSKDAVFSKLLSGQITIGAANAEVYKINTTTADEFKAVTANINQSQSAARPARVIGQTFDNQANGNIFLYDGPCRLANFASNYPMRWDAKRADNGALIGEGCYTVNQQQVTMIATTGLTVTRPMSLFQGGGSKSVFQSFSEGLQRATTYWNNSAAETQRNTTNLTPGLTGGSGMNCTPDGRGGFNCK